jgi:hypothetical protein
MNTDENRTNIKDFSGYKVGDTDTDMGKEIKVLIFKEEAFMVYLDSDLHINWGANQYYYEEKQDEKIVNEFGLVTGKITYLETIAHYRFSGKILMSIQLLLGQAMTQLLDDRNGENAMKIIEDVKQTIEGDSRRKYLVSSSLAFLTFMLMFLCFHIFLKGAISESYFFWTISLLGSIGAYFSIIIGLRKFVPQMTIENNIHYIEGVLRITTGVLASAIAILFIKADILLGFLKHYNNSNDYFCAISILTGFSLTLVPNLMNKLGSRFLEDSENNNKA